jgi:[ribosomal protein S18]-alanine N-acetyltransferase
VTRPAEAAREPLAVTLAPMRWWHVEEVHRLEVQLFSPDTWSQETFWSELAAPQRWYTVATTEYGEVLGYCGLAVSGADADLQTIAVAPQGQGRGLGRRLLTTLVDQAAEQGATSLMLEVRADNEPAIALYRSVGFDRIAVRRRYYQPGDIDAHIMRLRPIRATRSDVEP